jgi:hypothetical protein
MRSGLDGVPGARAICALYARALSPARVRGPRPHACLLARRVPVHVAHCILVHGDRARLRAEHDADADEPNADARSASSTSLSHVLPRALVVPVPASAGCARRGTVRPAQTQELALAHASREPAREPQVPPAGPARCARAREQRRRRRRRVPHRPHMQPRLMS